MVGRQSKEDPRVVRNRLIWEDSAAWIGRIFAIMVFMIGPGIAGAWLDRQFGIKFLSAVGIVVGMVLGMSVLMILVKVKRPSLEEAAAQQEKNDADGPQAGP